ncbi:phosphoglucomutase/phosphomannomutase family protein [Thermodesulfobacteriota bacterium]
MANHKIKFGTSGWRGVLGEDFTLPKVRLVLQAISNHIKNKKLEKCPVIIGYDTRFMGEKLAKEAVKVFAANKISSLLCHDATPTPVISFEVIRKKCAGGINFTASHNPYDYNGIKFSPEWGGPALPETTEWIEKEISRIKESDVKAIDFDDAKKSGLVKIHDPYKPYARALRSKVDVKMLASSNMHVAIDTLYGTAVGYLDRFLDEIPVSYEIIHNYIEPYFGHNSPEPGKVQLKELISMVASKKKTVLGLATDGDADRYGIIDSDGTFIEPNTILALLFDYLIETRGLEGGVSRSVATTHLVDAVASYHGREVYETPVGFKYIGELIAQDKLVIGGEESAGLTIRGHVPEKDGVLACLLVAEMVANKKKSLTTLANDLYKKVGKILTKRVNFRVSEERKERFLSSLKTPPKNIAGKKVTDVVTIDGTKLILEDGCWLLMRVSGTEPVIRLYVEGHSQKELQELISAGEDFINKK